MTKSKRPDRVYQAPHFSLPTVVATALSRDIVITQKAKNDAVSAFPPDLIEIDVQLREVVSSLVPDEFQFAQRKTLNNGGISWVDVYRIDFEGCDIWLKIKLERDKHGEFVVIISCHGWDEDIPV